MKASRALELEVEHVAEESEWPEAQALGAALLARQWRVATAESCTGGWIAKVLTDVAGSSQWFERGWVTYSNAAKQQDLGVDAALLQTQGAVSEPVVLAMACGALARAGVEIAVAVSGIAGPAGGSSQKPVGTVWLAWAWRSPAGVTREARHHLLPGDRAGIRRQTVFLALDGLLSRLPPERS